MQCVRERQTDSERERIETVTQRNTEKVRRRMSEVDSPADMSHRHHKMDSVDILKK